MFDSEIKITGKHASYIKFLAKKTTELNKDFSGAAIFKRYVDVYMTGAIIGLAKKRKAAVDNSVDDTATIFDAAVIGEQSNLKFIYRLVIMLNDPALSNDEKVDMAFRYDTDAEKVKTGMQIFNSYARGGIEWLYEKFTDGITTKEDYLQKIAEVVSEFKQDYIESYNG